MPPAEKSQGMSSFELTTAPNSSATRKGKCRKFFQQVEPTFSVSVPAAPYAELQFLDNFDPAKDTVVRKKAREWVNKNKEKIAMNGKPRSKASIGPGGSDGQGHEKQLAKKGAKAKAVVFSPRTLAANSIDPFGMLPDIGRNFDHIVKYFLSSQCPEEIPCSDDKYARENHSMITFRRENTVLGNMATSPLTFLLWLYATVSVRDNVMGTLNTEEAQWFYKKGLRAMQVAVKEASDAGVYPDHLLNAMSCITATANVCGMFETAELHRNALVKALALRGDGDILVGLASASNFTAKAAQWCEMMVAAQSGDTPKIPYCRQKSSPLPDEVIAEATMLTMASVSSLPVLSEPLLCIVQLLHQIGVGLARPPPPHTKVDSFIIQPMYDAEHRILRTLSAQKETKHGFSQVEVLLTEAFQLYFWATTRKLPPQTRLCMVLISRLMKALLPLLLEATTERGFGFEVELAAAFAVNNTPNQDATADHTMRFLSHTPETNNAITWALALGTLMTAPVPVPEQAWFKTHFKLQRRAMGIDGSEGEWRAFLDLFPTTDGCQWASLASLYSWGEVK